MQYIAYYLFRITVDFLYGLAFLLGSDYNTVNIWFYCIVGPLVFLILMFVLWTETVYGVVRHVQQMNIISNVLIVSWLLVIALCFFQILVQATPIFQALAQGDKNTLFNNCVQYLFTYNMGLSYVDINVFYFCILGPFVFVLLLFLDITGLYKFGWRWMAVFNEPHAWRYWLNAVILGCCVPCCYYALYVLKRYVLIK